MRPLFCIRPSFISWVAALALLIGASTTAQAGIITQTATITQTSANYLYFNAEDFDRLESPDHADHWRVIFSGDPGSVSGKTLNAQATGGDNGGGNDSFAIYKFNFTSPGDYTLYTYRLDPGGQGDSLFPPPDFGVVPFHDPGNNVNRWNGIDDNAWNELGNDDCCDSPGVDYYVSGIRGAYTVAAAGPQEFIIETRENNAQYDRFVLHKTKGLDAGQLDALTFSDATVANPVTPLPAPPPPEAAIALIPGIFNVRQIRVTGSQINNHAEALQVLAFADGGPNVENWTIVVDQSDTRNLIDIAGNGGRFPHNHPYPDGVNNPDQNDVVVHVTTDLPFFVPAGDWTIGFGSDDGGQLTLSGVTFLNEINTDGDPGLYDTILFNGTRGHGWTTGEFTVPAGGMTVDLDASFFERAGGDSFEIAISEGHNGNNVRNGDWLTLKEGQYGWSVIPEPSTFVLAALGLLGLLGFGRRRRK